MKGHSLLFAAIMCCAVTNVTAADDASAARAGRRTANTVSAGNSRKQTTTSQPTTQISARGGASNVQNAASSVTSRATIARTAVSANDTARGAAVSPRAVQTGTVQSRTAVTQPRGASVSARTVSRGGAVTRTAAQSQTKLQRTATRATTVAAISRAAQNTSLREQIMGRDYKTCRQVYYECMDEFCANKDSQLKRCACSSRIHEFDKTKKQLSQVEDKLLDFNQRLLTVNMDKEDAAALYTATEGELAYNKKDTSASKKILDEITKKLNSDTNSAFNQNLSAISLSLNTDAAFDNVDSLMGASTTVKEGVALYNAALPVCREMAAEVCDDESLALAESGYQMAIEQDCTTVAKTYETQTDQAREKIREGSALLDISRLDIHQKRNSDDILTCKKKMLDQLYDTSVCGESLSKCLDMSGQYIDPSTGQAFLTAGLSNLATLIIRPDMGQKWTNAPGNTRFVSFLDSKKKYLEPAMENCQDISDYVWDEFLEDALAQIKLAQESKLEEVRQSCTTLTTQCLSDAAKSLADFDSRALSTFGVMADKTANEMCADVRNACTALLQNTDQSAANDWEGGMTQITTDKTYETIIQTCREVGRACIIQNCKSISGNFGMCESIQNSVNRKSIINRTSCWNEVKECVGSAGEETISKIFDQIKHDQFNRFYTELYGAGVKVTNNDITCYTKDLKTDNPNCVYDICLADGDCSSKNINDPKCYVCRLAEKIWGNCEMAPATLLSEDTSHNKIRLTNDATGTSTLLAWFAKNTGTDSSTDSCRDTSCPSGYTPSVKDNNIECISSDQFSGEKILCPTDNFGRIHPYGKDDPYTNCCMVEEYTPGTNPQTPGNMINASCCKGPTQTPTDVLFTESGALTKLPAICTSGEHAYALSSFQENGLTQFLVCISDEPNIDAAITTDSAGAAKCNGRFVYINEQNLYTSPYSNNTAFISFIDSNSKKCVYTNGKWHIEYDETKECTSSPHAWSITPIAP